MFRSINPATEEIVAEYEELSDERVEAALAAAQAGFAAWRRTSFEERAPRLRTAAAYLRSNEDRFARLMSLEMGKPVREARAEIEKCAWACDYFAEHAQSYLTDEPTASAATESYVAFEPLGTVLAIMPWNFPFWQVVRFAAPALMAGNTAIVKHAPSTPQCALALQETFDAAGFPAGVYRNLFISHETAARLIDDDCIAAVTLTGSDRAGSTVAAQAGRALKKTVLELGGSDPFIVLPDANLDLTVASAVTARYQNTGQSCIAAKRFIVVEDVVEAFLPRFIEAVRQLRVGDPSDVATQIGPLARGDLRETIERQVQESVAMGARVETGGHSYEGRGFFYAPTVLTGATLGMPVLQEEVFGPVATVITARDAADAVALANRTRFGLGASIWTRDVEAGKRLAREIDAGSVFVNGVVASDPRLPFGGVKRSGYGRELSEQGIREFESEDGLGRAKTGVAERPCLIGA